jgi:hypothetical protein
MKLKHSTGFRYLSFYTSNGYKAEQNTQKVIASQRWNSGETYQPTILLGWNCRF